MEELIKATKPFNQHDACDQCAKRTDGLMTCTYSHDDITTKLCPDCIVDSGFCMCCGHYSAGMASFDFSEVKGYCSDCIDEMRDAINEFDEEYDNI